MRLCVHETGSESDGGDATNCYYCFCCHSRFLAIEIGGDDHGWDCDCCYY